MECDRKDSIEPTLSHAGTDWSANKDMECCLNAGAQTAGLLNYIN